MIKLIIHDIPPSNNKYQGNSHSYHAYRQEKMEWHELVRAAISQKPKEPYRQAIVEITYYFKDRRRRDPDNYSGKFLLDPLVKEGILADDSFSNVTLRLEAKVDKENPRTEIKISERGIENGRERDTGNL